MPRAGQRCSPTCKNIKGKCEEHKPVRINWKDKQERPFLKSAGWKRQARRVLHRDNTHNGGCQLHLDGCTVIATTVDHKVPVWYTKVEEVEDDQLQGLCKNCHQKKSSFEGVQAKRIKRLNNGLA